MSSIRVYLKENEENILDFPVTPSEVGCEFSNEISIEKINGLGEVSIYSGVNLKSTEISSFFPNHYATYCNYVDIKKPYEYVRMIEKWMHKGAKLRLIVADTHTNIQVIVNNFSYNEVFGTRDVYFSLSLVEYKDIKINKTTTSNDDTGTENNTDRPTEDKQENQSKTHTVVKGDSLWSIAQKNYGDGSKYPQIKEKNKAKYPSLSKNNYIYVGWVLEL